MSAYGKRELIDGIRHVRANTIQIANDIPEADYDFRPTPESRSIAETLVHIALYWSFDRHLHEAHLDTLEGFDFAAWIEQSRAEETKPRSKAEIVDFLRIEGERFVEWLERVPEEILSARVRIPGGGGSLNRFEFLLVSKEHEVHHRAQLTVLQRLVGIVPHFTRALAEMAQAKMVGGGV